MESIFLYLYPFLSFSCVIGYMPQIVEFVKAKEPPKSFSLMSWIVWLLEQGVSLGYGVFVLQDLMFCLLSSLDVLFIVVILGLAVFNRDYRFRKIHSYALQQQGV